MTFFDPYDRLKNQYSDNASRNNLIEEVLKKLCTLLGIDDTDSMLAGQLLFKDTFTDPSTITGNTAPVLVAWQNDIWVKPVTGQAFPIAAAAKGLIDTINSVHANPTTGEFTIDADSTVQITTDAANNKITLSVAQLKSQLEALINANSASISSLQGEVNINTAGISGLNTDISTLNNEIAQTRRDIDKKVSSINSVTPVNGDVTITPNNGLSISASTPGHLNLSLDATGITSDLISADADNDLTKSATDNKLFVPKGVSSINNRNGDISITSGQNVTITEPFAGTFEISSTGGGGSSGVSSVNSITGNVEIVQGVGISVTKAGQNITITNTGTTPGQDGDYFYNNKIYVGASAQQAGADGSYTKPYDNLVDALGGLTFPSKTVITSKNNDVPLSLAPASKVEIQKDECVIDLPYTEINGSFSFVYAYDPAVGNKDSLATINARSIKSSSADAMFTVDLSSNAFTGKKILEVEINVDELTPNNAMKILDVIYTGSLTSDEYLYITIRARALKITGNTGTTPLINIASTRSQTPVRVELYVENCVPTVTPGTVLFPLVQGNIAADQFILHINDLEDFEQFVDTSQATYKRGGGTLRVDDIEASDSIVVPSKPGALPASSKAGEIVYSDVSKSLYYSDGSVFKPISSSSSPTDDAVEDTAYYDDNSTSAIEDGSIANPFKTLLAAVADASAKANTNNRVWKVIAKDGASLANSENIVVGGTGKKLCIELIAPYMQFTGSVSVDFNSNVDTNQNLFMMSVDEFFGDIECINPSFVASTATRKEGIAIELRCNRKRVVADSYSFRCDLTSLGIDGQVLENSYVTYVERCKELIEDAGTGTSSPSLEYRLNSYLANTFLRVQCHLSILNSTAATSPDVPYIAFLGANIKGSVVRSSYVDGLANNGVVYDYLTSTNATDSSHIMAQSIDSLYARFDEADLKNVNAETTLTLPKNNTQNVEGQIGYDLAKQDVYYVDMNGRRYLGHNRAAGVTRFQAYGDAEVNLTTFTIDMPAMEIGVYDKTDVRQPETIATEPISINWRLSDRVLDGVTLKAVKPLDEHDQTADGNFNGICTCKIPVSLTGVCAFEDMSDASIKNTKVTFSIASSNKDKMLANLLTGNTVTFAKSGEDKTVSLIIYAVTSSDVLFTTNITILGYSNIGHGALIDIGVTNFLPPADVAAASALQLDTVYVGDNMSFDSTNGRFDPVNNNGEFVEMNYYPVFYREKLSLSKQACVLIGYNPRFASEETSGARAFWRSKVPPIIAETLESKWGSGSVAVFQQLSLHFKGGLANSPLNTINKGRYFAFEGVQFTGETYTKRRNFGNSDSIYGILNPGIAYGEKSKVAGPSAQSPEFVASFIQDEVSIYNICIGSTDMNGAKGDGLVPLMLTDDTNEIYAPDAWSNSCVVRADRIIALGEQGSVSEKALTFKLKRNGSPVGKEEGFFYYKAEGMTLPLRRELLERRKIGEGKFPAPQIPVATLSTKATQDFIKTAQMT